MEIKTKICNKCGVEKPVTEYYIRKNNNKSKLVYYRSKCKKCECSISISYIKSHKEERELYEINHKEKRKEYDKKSYYKNIEKRQAAKREYYNVNKIKMCLYSNTYRINNIEKINIYNSKYNKLRKSNDTNYKLRCNLRNNIYSSLKNNQKSGRALELLGCSIQEFKQWLESWFDDKMNWDNYGSYWNIDHILPCAAFELQNSEEQEVCFNYTNLRPLKASENFSKQDKII
jgi:hypothetical protein